LDALAGAAQGVRQDPDALERLLDLVTGVGGPEGVAPGASEEVTVTLAEGQYIIFNALDHFDHALSLPAPAGGQLPSLPLPPLAAGQVPPFPMTPPMGAQMAAFPLFYTPFRVAGPAITGVEPPAGTPVLMADFSFDLPSSLPAGTNRLKVTNTGNELHEMAVGRVVDGASIDSVIARFQDPTQPKSLIDVVLTFPNPNVDAANGVSTLSPGLSATVEATFTPGRYVMVCFIREAGSGLPHAALGMIARFDVR
jgi:uncharacterized cupredoxin-like copper-binding protein